MEDTAVHNFLEDLKQLMRSDHGLIARQNKHELLRLHDGIDYMSNFMKKTEKRFQDRQISSPVTKIRGAVFEAENFIDSFLVDQAVEVGVGVSDLLVNLERVNQDVAAIKNAVEEMMNVKPEKLVVGLEQDVDAILEKLEVGKALQVINIVGSDGIGKATLARELYQDIRSKEIFGVHAWVTMSRGHRRRQLLIDILESSSLIQDGDTEGTTDQQLGERLRARLMNKKYHLPDQCIGSTIISVGAEGSIKEGSTTHELRGLSVEKSWELFQNKVFGNQNSCPQELEVLGKEIVEKCQGVLLAIVLTCGMLARKDKTVEFWKHVAEEGCSINLDKNMLFYEWLPLHLKACFLYTGLFPPRSEILARSLIWMLVSEGFIIQVGHQNKCGRELSLEEIAQGYINKLVDRGLLMVSRKKV